MASPQAGISSPIEQATMLIIISKGHILYLTERLQYHRIRKNQHLTLQNENQSPKDQNPKSTKDTHPVPSLAPTSGGIITASGLFLAYTLSAFRHITPESTADPMNIPGLCGTVFPPPEDFQLVDAHGISYSTSRMPCVAVPDNDEDISITVHRHGRKQTIDLYTKTGKVGSN